MDMVAVDTLPRGKETRNNDENFCISNSIASNGTLMMVTTPQRLGEIRKSRDLDKTSGS